MQRSLPQQRDRGSDVPEAHGSVGTAAENPREAELDGFEMVHVTGEDADLRAVGNVPNADALVARSRNGVFIVAVNAIHQVGVTAGK